MDECDIWAGRKDHHGFALQRTFEWVDGKKHAVKRFLHEVTWERKNGPVPEGHAVAHKCGTPACIRLDHLILISETDGARYYPTAVPQNVHWKAKLTPEQVREIKMLIRLGESRTSVARQYGITTASVRDITTGKSWAHIVLDEEDADSMSAARDRQEQFRTPDCIKFSGYISPRGRGELSTRIDGRQTKLFAHEIAWEEQNGPIPNGIKVANYCGYKPCVNVAHLRLITYMQMKKLSVFGLNAVKQRASGEKHGKSKLTKDQVLEIKELLRAGERKAEIARAYGVTHASIASIERGRVWRDAESLPPRELSDDEILLLRQQYLDSLLNTSTPDAQAIFTSTKLTREKIYTRAELIDVVGLESTYAMRNGSLVRPDPSRFKSVWLFLTGPSSSEEMDKADVLSGETAYFPKHHQDLSVRNHKTNGCELVVFHRAWKHEHGRNGGFRYVGNFEFTAEHNERLVLKKVIDPLVIQAQRDIESFVVEHEMDAAPRPEGKRYLFLGSKHERDPLARAAAIRYHGTNCQACGFSFADFYGVLGDGYIQVHHHKPVASYGGQIMVDPISDMAVLCSNCHSMVHRNPEQPLTLDELKALIRTHESQR